MCHVTKTICQNWSCWEKKKFVLVEYVIFYIIDKQLEIWYDTYIFLCFKTTVTF